MKLALIGMFLLPSMAFAGSSDTNAVLKMLIDNSSLQTYFAGAPTSSTVGDLLAKYLSQDVMTISGLCEIEKTTFHESCALVISLKDAYAPRGKDCTFSFEKAQNVIIDNKVSVLCAL